MLGADDGRTFGSAGVSPRRSDAPVAGAASSEVSATGAVRPAFQPRSGEPPIVQAAVAMLAAIRKSNRVGLVGLVGLVAMSRSPSTHRSAFGGFESRRNHRILRRERHACHSVPRSDATQVCLARAPTTALAISSQAALLTAPRRRRSLRQRSLLDIAFPFASKLPGRTRGVTPVLCSAEEQPSTWLFENASSL